MTAITAPTSSIRKVNVRQDLLAVADLIEICFASTLDDDGREYLRQLRWTARDGTYLSWLQGAAERIATPLYGFVWEEAGEIAGNLSLIPLSRGGHLVYLIANVAVHPNYRRRGIARDLTKTALEHLRERGIETAWLQVRDDNPAAHHLYLSLGFVERARRTTWVSGGTPPLSRSLPAGVSIHRRRMQDWAVQTSWLRDIYPPDVSWNLPLSFRRLSPDPLHQLMVWLRGELQEHWSARLGGLPIGFLSWEPMRAASDILWLAPNPEHEDLALQTLLPYARAMLAHRRRALGVNYPAGRSAKSFLRSGFAHHQTLIWMNVDLNHQ